MKERKVHVDFDEAALAATSGLVFGVSIGSTLYLDGEVFDALRTALAITPLALSGAAKTYLKEILIKNSE